jgi:hypothetical protein
MIIIQKHTNKKVLIITKRLHKLKLITTDTETKWLHDAIDNVVHVLN